MQQVSLAIIDAIQGKFNRLIQLGTSIITRVLVPDFELRVILVRDWLPTKTSGVLSALLFYL